MSDLKKLIWDIEKQKRIGIDYYRRFAAATQKYTVLLGKLRLERPKDYEAYKQEMEARFGKPEESVVSGGDVTGESDTVDGYEIRSRQASDELSASLSPASDSPSDDNGGSEVREPQLAPGDEVE